MNRIGVEDPAGGKPFDSWLSGPCGTALADRRILTGPALPYILYGAASIGPPARSSLIRLSALRFEITEGLTTGRVPYTVPLLQSA